MPEGGMPGGPFPGAAGGSGPTVDEVDWNCK
jgi:hypothetical protein